jgi:hypothetical protein
MKNRVCRVFVEIKIDGASKRYSLRPLALVGSSGVVMAFRLTGLSDSPNPLYEVTLLSSGLLRCNCPAFVWDERKGKEPAADPAQPSPTCKHCDALRVTGLLPLALLDLHRADREASIRNAELLRAEKEQAWTALRAEQDRCLELESELASLRKPRRTRKAKAA